MGPNNWSGLRIIISLLSPAVGEAVFTLATGLTCEEFHANQDIILSSSPI